MISGNKKCKVSDCYNYKSLVRRSCITIFAHMDKLKLGTKIIGKNGGFAIRGNTISYSESIMCGEVTEKLNGTIKYFSQLIN